MRQECRCCCLRLAPIWIAPPRFFLTCPTLLSPRLPSSVPQMAACELPSELRLEKQRLLDEGFGRWSKRELRSFIQAVERYGRGERESIISEAVDMTDRPASEVGRYYDTFFGGRGEAELSDWKKIEDKLAKAEARIQRRKDTETVLATRVGSTPDAYRTLALSYGPNKMAIMKGFTEENDRFLLVTLARLGYGSWDALRSEILRSEQFRFDWFIKSRSPLDLQRRCDTLIRLLEKAEGIGQGDGEGGAGGAGKKRRAATSGDGAPKAKKGKGAAAPASAAE